MKIIKVADLFTLNTLKVYHKFVHGEVPFFINSLFQRSNHNHDTRYDGLIIPRTRTTRSEKRLKCLVPKLLNITPNLVTDKLATHSLKGFANYFKSHCLERYKETCADAICYVCGRK